MMTELIGQWGTYTHSLHPSSQTSPLMKCCRLLIFPDFKPYRKNKNILTHFILFSDVYLTNEWQKATINQTFMIISIHTWRTGLILECVIRMVVLREKVFAGWAFIWYKALHIYSWYLCHASDCIAPLVCPLAIWRTVLCPQYGRRGTHSAEFMFGHFFSCLCSGHENPSESNR